MGSFVELNYTLQITTEQGFPADILDLKRHQKNPIKLSDLKQTVFEFHDKQNARLYHVAPTKVFLVHNTNGKWLHWGRIIMLEQSITWDGKKHTTSGKYQITEIYDPEAQIQMTKHNSENGKSYF